jgi:hypothetical protein
MLQFITNKKTSIITIKNITKSQCHMNTLQKVNNYQHSSKEIEEIQYVTDSDIS